MTTRAIVCKASPTGDQVIESRIIEIGRDIEEYLGPAGSCSEDVAAELQKADAQLSREALRALPQGTRDRLLIMMLEDAATVLRIPGSDLQCGALGLFEHPPCMLPFGHVGDHKTYSGGVLVGWSRSSRR